MTVRSLVVTIPLVGERSVESFNVAVEAPQQAAPSGEVASASGGDESLVELRVVVNIRLRGSEQSFERTIEEVRPSGRIIRRQLDRCCQSGGSRHPTAPLAS